MVCMIRKFYVKPKVILHTLHPSFGTSKFHKM